MDLKGEVMVKDSGHCSSELTTLCRGWQGMSTISMSQYETHHDSIDQKAREYLGHDHQVAHRLTVEILTPNFVAMRPQVQPFVRIR